MCITLPLCYMLWMSNRFAIYRPPVKGRDKRTRFFKNHSARVAQTARENTRDAAVSCFNAYYSILCTIQILYDIVCTCTIYIHPLCVPSGIMGDWIASNVCRFLRVVVDALSRWPQMWTKNDCQTPTRRELPWRSRASCLYMGMFLFVCKWKRIDTIQLGVRDVRFN